MDKSEKNKAKKQDKVNNNYKGEYDYDFVPVLNEWVNIDEQKETAKRLENMGE